MFKVFIDMKLVAKVGTAEAAWKVIGNAPFGCLYEVRDENDFVRPEFIPH